MRPFIIGIGGAHSGAGKTTYASLLLQHLKGWGAIKYTKTALYVSMIDDLATLSEDGKDTKRFLEAGAERVLWVQSPPSGLGEVLPLAVERLSDLRGIIVEGNSAIEFLRPDIILFIFGSDSSKIKESAKRLLEKAHAVVAGEGTPVSGTGGAVRRFSRSPEKGGLLLTYIKEMVDNKEKIQSSLRERSVEGRISCPLARKIAKELAVSYKELGKVADELQIKITDCELGCF
jgi:LAO/AO transport system kinase